MDLRKISIIWTQTQFNTYCHDTGEKDNGQLCKNHLWKLICEMDAFDVCQVKATNEYDIRHKSLAYIAKQTSVWSRE